MHGQKKGNEMKVITTEPVADQYGTIWPTGTEVVQVDGHSNPKYGGIDFRVIGDHDRDHVLWGLVPSQYKET